MNKRLIGAGCMSILILLNTGCSSGAKNETSDVAGKTPPAATAAALTPVPEPAASQAATASPVGSATPLPAAKSVTLIPEVQEYTGSSTEFQIAGTRVLADFSADQKLPLGLFMPETMIRFDQEGRTAWGTADKLNYITIVIVKGAETKAANAGFEPGTDQSLHKYKEYLGSRREEERSVEAFAFTAMGQAYRAELTVTAEQREAILPVMIQMLSQIEYLEKQPPIVPGVFLQEPEVGDSPGDRQALQETMSCIEAWAAKDREKFAATMYSPGANDGLQFLLDERYVYRFHDLTLAGIPIEGTKRAGFYVRYFKMTSEGYIREGTYEISLLKNKQGEWKIANID